MKKTLRWIGILFIGVILLPVIILFFIYKKAMGKREYDPQALVNLERNTRQFVKNTAPLSDIDSRYKYVRLTEKMLPPATEIEVGDVEDKKIQGPNGKIPIRIYTPKSEEGPYKICVFCHGGGFVVGSIKSHDKVARRLAQETGMRVVSVGYRLAPEKPFPAGIKDAYEVLKWIGNHQTSLRMKKDEIVVAGDSAGANMAAVIAQMAKEEGKWNITHQILIYPPTDFFSRDASALYPSMDKYATGYFLTKEALDKYFYLYLKGAPEEKYNPRVAPIRNQNLKDLPKALIITAECDPLRDQGEAYAEKLKEAGVFVSAKRMEKVPHAFIMTNCEATEETYRLIREFLAE